MIPLSIIPGELSALKVARPFLPSLTPYCILLHLTCQRREMHAVLNTATSSKLIRQYTHSLCDDNPVCADYCSPGRLLLQLTILTLSATTCCEFSILNVTSLIKNVQTSSQKRYVSR